MSTLPRHRPKQDRPPPARTQAIGTCPECGKQSFTSKNNAKRAAKVIYPGQRMRVYNCPGTCWWHLTSQDAAQTTRLRNHRATQKTQEGKP